MQIIKRAATAPKRPLYEIEPEEYAMKPVKGRVAIFDSETDPFKEKRVVKPFTCGFYIPDSDEYYDFWGDDCIAQYFAFMAANFPEEEFTVFVHNGGGFDFFFMTDFFDSDMSPFIINGRLVRIFARNIEFRDSYAMIPVALSKMGSKDGKLEFNYDKMEAGIRELHKDEIRLYQKQDCVALGIRVTRWLEMFGNRLTMASAALGTLNSYHGFENMAPHIDEAMRPYYFGGRCQAFETGIIEGDFVGYDIKSSYPNVMARVEHPISSTPIYEKRITERTHFARIRAWSNGALPIRKDDGGLEFPIGVRDFHACIHEINAGIATGTLRILKVYESFYFSHKTTFADFINTFHSLRNDADATGDEINKLFYKLVMNSSYGKLAQDPRKYENWLFDPSEIPSPLLCMPCNHRIKDDAEKITCINCESKTHSPYGWYVHTIHHGRMIYARPQQVRGNGFFNVATAASITSAARASLLYGINAATRPIYCDTDSIFCERLDANEHVTIDDKILGGWAKEFEADTLYIGGKKLYGVKLNGEEVKKASKGVKLTIDEIEMICRGETVEYANPVPKFSIFKDPDAANTVAVNDIVTASFVTRKISRTDKL